MEDNDFSIEMANDELGDAIKLLEKITKDPVLSFKVETMELDDKLETISLNMENISKGQYKELTNMIKQFEKILEDYLTEQNIKLKELSKIRNEWLKGKRCEGNV